MIDKEKASLNMRKQWMKFGCAFFFYQTYREHFFYSFMAVVSAF